MMIFSVVAHLEVVFPYEQNSRLCISRAAHEDAARGLPKEAQFARRWSPYYDEDDEKMDKAAASGDSRLETKSKLQPLLYKEKPKPVLVVGATGRVGQRIVRQLLTQVKYFPMCGLRKMNVLLITVLSAWRCSVSYTYDIESSRQSFRAIL
jgi:hypothetical protein